MKKILLVLFCIVLTFSLMSIHNPKTVQADTNQADLVVNASVLNLREGPGLSYPVLLSLKQDDRLTILQKSGDWIQVQVNGKTGWVAAWLTKTISNAAPQTEFQSKTVISQVDYLNVRVEPSLSANVLAQLFVGNEARFIKETEEWIQIEFQNSTGWVHKKYASISIEEQATTATDENTPDESKATSANVFTVNVSAVNIRKKPDLNAKKLGTIKNGEQYDVLSRDGNWIEIEYAKGKKGWIYSFYGTFSTTKSTTSTPDASKDAVNSVTIIYDGTNLREEPSTASNVVERVNLGEVFTIIESIDEWYKIALPNNQHAYVANWVVSLNQELAGANNTETPKTQRKKGTFNGLTIVIDPGHGGNDHGTTGVRGTAEKGINLLTAELLTSKLRSAGANVVLTRESDKYVDLRKRVAVSHQNNADAFISIHYDASETASVSGFTTYYMNSNQKKLAQAVHNGLASKVTLRDRGAQPGNYLVLRENRQAAILLELGYLSNSSEERTITTDYYREQATLGIYNGLLNYFGDLLK